MELTIVYILHSAASKHIYTQFEAKFAQIKDSKLVYQENKVTELSLSSSNTILDSDQRKLFNLSIDLNENKLINYFNKTNKKIKSIDHIFEDNTLKDLFMQRVNRLGNEFMALSQKTNAIICLPCDRNELLENKRLSFGHQIIKPILKFNKTTEGIEYQLKLYHDDHTIEILTAQPKAIIDKPAWIIIGNKILRIESINANKITPFLKSKTIKIPNDKINQYFKGFIKEMAAKAEIEASGFDLNSFHKPPTIRLKIVEDFIHDKYAIDYEFDYGACSFSKHSKLSKKVILDFDNNETPRFNLIERNPTIEKKLLLELENFGFTNTEEMLLRNGAKNDKYGAIQLLSQSKPKLDRNNYKIDSFKIADKLIQLNPYDITTSYDTKQDWFDLKAEIIVGDQNIPFSNLIKNIKNNDPFLKLNDGSYFIIPEEWLSQFTSIAMNAIIDSSEVKISKAHFTLLEDLQLNSTHDDKKNTPNEMVEFEIPKQLNVTLRPYQYEGARWLIWHQQNQLGALLADDMGLGKTVQTLCALLYLKNKILLSENQNLQVKDLFAQDVRESNYLKSLLILPSSLVFNWLAEIEKFAPSLCCINYTSDKRKQYENRFETADIIITSYPIALRDIHVLVKHSYNYIILDESHYIKNRNSKIFQSIHQLKATNRLSLSGTPIENSLDDLFSQMEFLNPNILGDYNFFKQHYKIPIESYQDQNAIQDLKKLINPFILRRNRDDVLDELPELHEQIFYTEMTAEQSSIFEELKSQARNALLQLSDQEQNKLIVLNTLMKLRKVANHPILENKDSKAPSGKMKDVLIQLENLIKSNQKVLVFSSFTSHLQLYIDHCIHQKIMYASLMGEDTPTIRNQAVNKFNTDPNCQIFFLSIKAGGVGLNLTEANYVFILDPWWNPFVERQAIARAHRMGQKNKVTAIRFISKNSIEEKILTLQQNKLNLATEIYAFEDELDLDINNISYILS